mmetsp:Transcript_32749/g.45738  ORF Transcript_32749/g.45738 Transcript_32749/m.45738 type:complete len:214 (-) Transcript_32749:61-702(-)
MKRIIGASWSSFKMGKSIFPLRSSTTLSRHTSSLAWSILSSSPRIFAPFPMDSIIQSSMRSDTTSTIFVKRICSSTSPINGMSTTVFNSVAIDVLRVCAMIRGFSICPKSPLARSCSRLRFDRSDDCLDSRTENRIIPSIFRAQLPLQFKLRLAFSRPSTAPEWMNRVRSGVFDLLRRECVPAAPFCATNKPSTKHHSMLPGITCRAGFLGRV